MPTLVGLGLWQLKRAAWKADVIAAMKQRLAAPAVAYDGPPTGPVEDWRFQRVRVEGRFAGEPILIHHVRDGEAGWRIMRRFDASKPTGAAALYVDLGFLPGGPDGPATAPPLSPSGEVAIEGALRESVAPGLFTPPVEPERRRLFVRNIAAMAAMDGLAPDDVANVALVVHPDPNPADALMSEATVALRDNHIEYALTWFGLASVLIAVYGSWHYHHRRVSFGVSNSSTIVRDNRKASATQSDTHHR